jgi:hypothetical protein
MGDAEVGGVVVGTLEVGAGWCAGDLGESAVGVAGVDAGLVGVVDGAGHPVVALEPEQEVGVVTASTKPGAVHSASRRPLVGLGVYRTFGGIEPCSAPTGRERRVFLACG